MSDEPEHSYSEMTDDDYKLTPCGHLRGKISITQYGKVLGEFVEQEDALKFVKEHMTQEQFWPDVWWISDHGNVSPIYLDWSDQKEEDSVEDV